MAKKEVNKEVKKTSKADKNKKTFFKSFKTELKKVVWPTPKQLVNNTATVITMVLICAVIVAILNFVFEKFNEHGINRIRDLVVVQQDDNTTANETNTTSNETNTATTNETSNSTSEDGTLLQVNEDGSAEVIGGDNTVDVTTEGTDTTTTESNTETENTAE